MRLIDDVALTTAIEKRIDEATNEDFAEGLSEALIEVHFAPTVDAVEVVRCKECKYMEYMSTCTKNGIRISRVPNDYCSRGVRKDE